jgi:aminomethyltransferase
MKKTALFDSHVKLGAKMVEFANFLMPIQYDGIKSEHLAVKHNLGVFDVSHMGEFLISGNGSLELLQSILSNDVSILKDGEAQYNCLLNDSGGIVDDLILYKLSNERYMLVVNAGNIEKDWNFLLSKNIFRAEMDNLSDEYSLLSIQGPKTLEVIQKLTQKDLSSISYYNFIVTEFAGQKNIIVSNTGYTGCGGFEIYCKNPQLIEVWDKIMLVGKSYNIKPIGLAARDTLRLEMGFCLYGNELSDNITPIEAGLTWITKFSKEFNGYNILKEQKENGVKKKLIGFELIEKGIPRKDYEIYDKDQVKIGRVTSGTMSPSLGKAIGLGFVDNSYAKTNATIHINIRNNLVKAIIIKPPFK